MAKIRTLGLFALVAAGMAAQTAPDRATSATSEQRIEELETRVRQLEQQIEILRSKLEKASPGLPAEPPATSAQSMPSPQPAENTETRLPVSGYMDFHFNKPRGEPGQLDFHRFVLLFGHSFSNRIKFWSELELEHAFVEGRAEKGEVELEQAYLDFLVTPYFNFRGGMLLAPVGLINERHEPPAFNGVERPFVDTVILPSTWFDTGVGVFGDLGRGFVYKAYVMSPLDATGFDAAEGLRGGRQRGFHSSFQNVAQTGRLEYHGLSRLALGASFWRGNTGFNLRGVNPRVNVFELDGRYRLWRFDFRGEFAQAGIGQAGELNRALQREHGGSPNVAERLRGFYWESAARVLPRRARQDLVLFTRYENFDTQKKMPRGFLPLKQFDRSAWVMGATYYPEPDVALKFDYSLLRNSSAIVRPRSSVNFGIGWWF
ncbi:MAG: hypothetical protein HY236_16140 [Acidobacteria bacterium]|nr:hypothetical protein [Acidobacteriota bacterium]